MTEYPKYCLCTNPQKCTAERRQRFQGFKCRKQVLEGRALRDQGMATAMDHADQVEPGWKTIARRYLETYLATHPGGTFMAEDVRRWAHANGCPVPPVLRAWGGIIAGARKAGLIEKVDHAPVTNPRAHCSIVAVWRQVGQIAPPPAPDPGQLGLL